MKRGLFVILILIVLGAVSIAGVGAYVASDLPDVNKLSTCFKGNMFSVSVCPGSNNYARLNEVAEIFVDALIVSEDASFWHHEGLDWFEIKESFKRNLKEGGFARGGSTISQQLVKNAFFSSEKSLTRKIKEILLTREMEKKFSKEFILEKYINIVEFGPDLYGLKAASQFYFYKNPSQLNALESAYLVHLLPSPKSYSDSFRNFELSDFSKKMIMLIIKRLLHYKKIDPAQFEFAQMNLERFPWYGISDQPFELDSPDPDDIDPLLMEDNTTAGSNDPSRMEALGEYDDDADVSEELNNAEPPSLEKLEN